MLDSLRHHFFHAMLLLPPHGLLLLPAQRTLWTLLMDTLLESLIKVTVISSSHSQPPAPFFLLPSGPWVAGTGIPGPSYSRVSVGSLE